jgi:hypothetical protein
LQHQTRKLLLRKLKRKILWKPIEISLYLLIESGGRYTVQCRQVRIEHHLLAANDVNRPLDPLAGNQACLAFGHTTAPS